jgi:starch-binding outer membrane protein, SusD/RagB family
MKKLANRIFQEAYMKMFLVLCVILICTSGCEDQLKPKVFNQLSPENFFGSEEDFNAAVIVLYNPFTSDWGTTDTGDGTWYPALYNANNRTYLLRSMLTTDEMENGWDANLEEFNFGPSTWAGGDETTYYKVRYVARATDAIAKIAAATNVEEGIRNKYVAEAKVLRAWLMYVLYDFYGPVNVKVDPETLSDTEILPRPTDQEYTSRIEQDLIEAIPDLTDMYNSDPVNWGRVSKGVARMLLLKLYMHTKQWDKAESVGKDILSMGYTLEPNYADIFKVERNNEVIYAVPSSDAAPNWYPQHVFPDNYQSSPIITRGGGWYGYSMPWDFFDKFEATDLRRTTTIIESYTNTSGGTTDRTNGLRGAIPLKYTGIQGPGPNYPADVVIFRLGEVLLSVAEAINEQRGPDDAYAYVNQVRDRAGVGEFSGMTQAEFEQAILDERGRELYAEGTRRQDLIRHGEFIDNAVNRGKDAKSYQTVFPIPNAVILEGNGIIEQNPGYASN